MHLWLKENIKVDTTLYANNILQQLERYGYVHIDDDYLLSYKDAEIAYFYKKKLEVLLWKKGFVGFCLIQTLLLDCGQKKYLLENLNDS